VGIGEGKEGQGIRPKRSLVVRWEREKGIHRRKKERAGGITGRRREA
jgi:hypothetical protein